MERIKPGDIVQHFKREFVCNESWYTYKVLSIAEHTETKQKFVIYQALYRADPLGVNYGIYARPYDMFMSQVDHEKYPQYHQKYRFQVIREA